MNFVFVPESRSSSQERSLPRAPVARPTRIVPVGRPVSRPVRVLKSAPERINKRWSERAQVIKSGTIGLDGRDPIACVVLNLSKFGALLEVADAMASDAFVLVFTNNRVRSEVSCTVRWRNGSRMGVHFVGAIRTTVDARRAI